MSKRFYLQLCLHFAAAKTVTDYLSEAGDDKDKALESMRRDLVQRESQNGKARAFQRAYSRLIEKLKLPADPEDADAASDAALEAIKAMSEAGASASQISKALEKLGLDPSKLEEQIGTLRTQAAAGAEGSKLKRELAYRDAADALGYDAAKLSKLLRDESALPEKRKIKVQENGAEVEREVWGFAGEGTAFTPLLEHGEVKGFEAALKKAPSSETTPTPVPSGPSFPTQRQGQTVNPSGVKVDPASIVAAIAANGAGSI